MVDLVAAFVFSIFMFVILYRCVFVLLPFLGEKTIIHIVFRALTGKVKTVKGGLIQ